MRGLKRVAFTSGMILLSASPAAVLGAAGVSDARQQSSDRISGSPPAPGRPESSGTSQAQPASHLTAQPEARPGAGESRRVYEAQSGFQIPPADVLAFMEAAPAPTMHLSRDGRWLIVATRRSMVPAGELLSAPSNRVELGAGRADAGRPGTFDFARPSQNQFLLSYSQFRLVNTETGDSRAIEVPTGGLSAPIWAPNGRTFVFARTTERGVELWAADIASTRARQLTPPHVHLAAATDSARAIGLDDTLIIPAIRWIDDEHFIYRSVPDERPPLPARPQTDRDPIISEVQSGSLEGLRTDTGLRALRNDYDDLEFDYYMTSQPRIVDVTAGDSRPFGPPAPYARLEASASGLYILTQRQVRPYPRDSRQPSLWITEILDRNGNVVRRFGPSPIFPAAGSVEPRPRNFAWSAAGDDQLFYVLTARSESGVRENRLMRLRPPFAGPGDALFSSPQEIGFYGPDFQVQIFTLDRDRVVAVVAGAQIGVRDRAEMWLARTGQGNREPRRFLDWQTYYGMESYSASFIPVLTDSWGSNARAKGLVAQGDWIYLRGNRSDGRGYLDRVNVETSERQEIFLAEPDVDERIVAVLDPAADRYITIAQAADTPARLVLHCRSCGSSRILYQTAPNEATTRFGREVISYRRADGVALEGELLTPSGYRGGDPLPVIITGYPINAQPDGQARRNSDQSYSRPPSWANPNDLVRALLVRGYAVFRADMPLTGGLQANDNLGAQLVQNASAAVDVLVERGIAQRGRIGVVGHSFGGTMVATLLANSDLFAAGVAMNGFYNFTNVPFRLQLDTRTLWEAPDTWLGASALFKADRIRAPLLLVHGQLDGNVPPDQAVQMYRALSGLGRDARLVLLPDEAHSYGSREAQLTIVNEMLRWFDRYLGAPDNKRLPDDSVPQKSATPAVPPATPLARP